MQHTEVSPRSALYVHTYKYVLGPSKNKKKEKKNSFTTDTSLGSSCWPAERGASAALRSIQQIMTVVLKRKLNVKLLPLVSAKWSANYIQKLENSATFSCLSLSPLSLAHEGKRSSRKTSSLHHHPPSSSSSSPQSCLTV